MRVRPTESQQLGTLKKMQKKSIALTMLQLIEKGNFGSDAKVHHLTQVARVLIDENNELKRKLKTRNHLTKLSKENNFFVIRQWPPYI